MVQSPILRATPATLLTFIQTHVYTAAAKKLLDDKGQRTVGRVILANPRIGAVEAGVRKARVALSGVGKRGGARVIYYYIERKRRVYLLDIYSKNDRPALSQAEGNDTERASLPPSKKL